MFHSNKSLFFKPVWQKSNSQNTQKKGPFKNLLIFSDNMGQAKEWILENQIENFTLLRPGKEFYYSESGQSEIDISNDQHHQELFNQLKKSGNFPDTILHFFSFSEIETGFFHELNLNRAFNFGLFHLHKLLNCLKRFEPSKIDLFVISNNGSICNASLSGYIQSARAEIPWLNCKIIYLEQESLEENSKHLTAEMNESFLNAEVSFNKGQREIKKYRENSVNGRF